ncbi:MAG: hypothetical protein WCX48_10450 [Bacteroidales bacterium]
MTLLCPGCKDKNDCCNVLVHDMINGLLSAKGIVISLKDGATDEQQKIIALLEDQHDRIGKALDRCNR